MNSVFISYRRSDSAGEAGRLYDRLKTVFGPDNVFFDINAIAIGKDFERCIHQAISKCDVVLAVMGETFTSVSGTDGNPRLQSPQDYVRQELQNAIALEKPIIPILVNNSQMPSPASLPVPIRPIAKRQAVRLHHGSWDRDIDALIRAIGTPEKAYASDDPWPGLLAYDERRERTFFGRSHDVMAALASLRDKHCLVIHGASGSGKSSLMKAGLVPELKKSLQFADDTVFNVVVSVVPTNHPLRALQRGLSTARPKPCDKKEWESFLAEAAARREGLCDIARRFSEYGCRLILCVDQLEEAAVLCRDVDERTAFLELFSCFTEYVENADAYLLATVRADLLHAITDAHKALSLMLVDRRLYLLGMMDSQSLAEVITAPLAGRPWLMEDTLPATIMGDLGAESGSLALLSHVLKSLWDGKDLHQGMLTIQAYQEVGRVGGALARQADAAMTESLTNNSALLSDISPSERKTHLSRLFLQLAHATDTGGITRHRRKTTELSEAVGLGTDKVDELISPFVSHRRLLLEDVNDNRNDAPNRPQNSERQLEIAHEQLIDAWPWLRDLLVQHREALILRSELMTSAQKRESAGRRLERWTDADSRLKRVEELLSAGQMDVGKRERAFVQNSRAAVTRNIRIRQVVVLGMGLLLLAVSALSLIAYKSQKAATLQKTIAIHNAAQARKNELTANYHLAKMFEEKATAALKAAKNSTSAAPYEKAWLYTLAALNQNIGKGRTLPVALGYLQTPELRNSIRQARWVSPIQPKMGHVVTFSPDGKFLATGAPDQTVRLWSVTNGEAIRVFEGHNKTVNCVAFSPDGRRLVTGSDDETVRVWDVLTAKQLFVFKGAESSVSSVAFGPNGATIVSGDHNNIIHLWDVASGKQLHALAGHESSVTSATFSPDGTHIASASLDTTVRLWNVKSGNETSVFTGHTESVTHVVFQPEGRKLASASLDKSVRIWDIATGKRYHILNGHTDDVSSVAFSQDGQTLVSGSVDHTIRMWNVSTGQETGQLTGHESPVSSVAFSPDGKRIASADRNHAVRLWDVVNLKEMTHYEGHGASISSVAFSPNGKWVASGARDDTVRLCDISSGKKLRTFKGHTADVLSVVFSPDGKRIATSSIDKTVRLWETDTGHTLKTFSGHTRPVHTVAFSSDGTRIATGSADKTVRLWDVASGRETAIFEGHTSSIYSVAFQPNSSHIASGSADRTVRTWDTTSGEALNSFEPHYDGISSVAFSPDGEWIASGSWDRTIRVFDAETGMERHVLEAHKEPVNSVAFSPDGKQLASSSADRTVRIWDTNTGTELGVFKGHRGIVQDVAYSPDGAQIISGANDRTLRLWHTTTGNAQDIIFGVEGTGCNLSFTPDGKHIVYAGRDRTVHLWDIESKEDVRLFPGNSARFLAIEVSPNGRQIALSSWDQIIHLWDVEAKRKVRTFEGHGRDVTGIAFSPDGERLASASKDRTIRLWDVRTGREMLVFKGHEKAVASVAFTSDGKSIISGSWDGTVRIWDVTNGQLRRTLEGHRNSVYSVAVGAKDRRIISGSRDETIRLWDVAAGKEILVIDNHKDDVLSVAISHDNQFIASGLADGTTRLWEMATGDAAGVFGGFGTVDNVKFSPDGGQIAMVLWDQTIRIRQLDLIRPYLSEGKHSLAFRKIMDYAFRLLPYRVDGINLVDNPSNPFIPLKTVPAPLRTFMAPRPMGQDFVDWIFANAQ